MMATTHGLVGAGVAALALPVVPDEVAAPLVVTAAFLGGVAPDLDVAATHRRTLHYPVGFGVVAVLAGATAAATGGVVVTLVAVALGSAAVHAVSDVFGGSPESKPWDPTLDIAVYNHLTGRWHRPRRWVRYSGAPEDFLLGAAAGAVALATPATGPALDAAVLAVVAFSGLFALARKRLGLVPRAALALVPRRLRLLVPRLRVEEREGGTTTLAIRFER